MPCVSFRHYPGGAPTCSACDQELTTAFTRSDVPRTAYWQGYVVGKAVMEHQCEKDGGERRG